MHLDLQETISQTLELQQQKLLQLQTSQSSLDLTELTDSFYALAEAFSARDLQGFADSVALYAELLGQIDRQSGFEAVLLETAADLQNLLTSQRADRWVNLLEHLADARWPMPVQYEDLAFLAEILPLECENAAFSEQAQSLTEAAVAGTEEGRPTAPSEELPESAASDTPSLTTEPAVQAAASDTAATHPPGTEGYLESSAEYQESSEDRPANSDECLATVSELRKVFTGQATPRSGETIQHLSDRFSELDLHGLADMLALYCELQQQELSEDAIGMEMQNALRQLFDAPDIAAGVTVLGLLGDPRWPQPVPAEDCEFLQDLLLENCEYLQSVVPADHPAESIVDSVADNAAGSDSATDLTENTSGPAGNGQPPAEHTDIAVDAIAAAATTETATPDTPDSPLSAEDSPARPEPAPAPQLPDFGTLDAALLEQPGPELDPAAMEMLASTIQSLCQQWENGESLGTAGAMRSQLESLKPIQRAAETLRLHGTAVILNGLQKNLQWLAGTQPAADAEQVQALKDTLSAVSSYLLQIGEKTTRQALLDIVCDSPLPVRPDSEQSALLIGLLALPSVLQSSSITRQTATPEAVSLARETDIDAQLLDMLYTELPQLSDELLSQLQQITVQQQIEALSEAQRTAHTIKGLANMAGIAGIANLTHNLEDILEILTDESRLPEGTLADDLMQAADCLAAATESITDDRPAPDDILSVLQRLMDWHYQLRSGDILIEEATQLADDSPTGPGDGPVESEASDDQNPLPASTEKRESDSFRVSRQLLDNLFRIAGENSTLTAQLDEELTQLRALTRSGRERQRAMQRVMFELEQQLNEHFTLSPAVQQEDEEFDPLEMDRYNEMHTTLARLHEVATDVAEVGQGVDGHVRTLSELHVTQSGLQKEALNTVLSTRLVEVSTITTRLQRILRQACRSTGKQARLNIAGGDTRIDSQILNQLADPLMHMIRNAVDHGLESDHGRFEAGKEVEGEISLSFSQDNDLIRIRLSDDGHGIDLNAIHNNAIAKALIDPEQQPSEAELLRYILLPGFSTSESVSQLSGRGIGLDVVNQQITRMQGTLELHSESGKGTRFDITLPASSMMIKSLLVRAGKQVFALVSHGIEQSLLSIDGEYVEDSDGAKFVTAEQTYPAVSLEQLVSSRGYDYRNSSVHPVLLVKTSAGETIALLVREVLAHRELVFKAMGDFVPDIPGIPGLTILANGEVAPVVDLPGRIRHYQDGERGLQELPELEYEAELPSVMVVDDSISARKSLATLLQDTGYEVHTAIDGLDALNQIRKQPPNVILTDLEMPRMNGIELTSSLRSKAETRDIPVIMITSRSTIKHREEAEQAGINAYINKPWTENELLDQMQTLLVKNKNNPE
ncbi:hybrid sensor histidine kinase/response regulator [Marinobacterium jannaschii]|uniref:hybrid sensor histidine kinase/response regulator n=1 Tax=Marinobacterium jannaschii TaxID=64970 RepID=UPI000AD8870F|nr:response regulator [Marinobacterium jannaschii]